MWPGPKPVTRRHCTWKRSPWYSERTFMPRFMPGRPSACRRSGKRCNGAGRSGWATACVSSTTSRSTGTDEWPSAGWPATSATSRVPLELCPTSNVHTGAVGSLAEHPIGLLRRLGFRATINTDNRLMSGVSLSSEMSRCAEVFGWGWADLRWLSINAMKSAFYDFDERLALINGVIKPGYDALAAEAAFRVSSSSRG